MGFSSSAPSPTTARHGTARRPRYLLGIKIWLHQDISPSRGRPEQHQDPAQQDGLHPRACLWPLTVSERQQPGFIAQPCSGLTGGQAGRRKGRCLGSGNPGLLCPLFGTISQMSPRAPGVISWRTLTCLLQAGDLPPDLPGSPGGPSRDSDLSPLRPPQVWLGQGTQGPWGCCGEQSGSGLL